MQRYFAKFSPEENRFFITGEDCRHIARVMRMKEKDQIICVSEDQRTALCSIVQISDDEVIADVIQWKEGNVELPIDVTIVSGLPKGDKLEWIIQKGLNLELQGLSLLLQLVLLSNGMRKRQKKS